MKSVMVDAPLVSVVIPSYNRRSLVIDAIESALEQEYPAVEVIVVDDGSTDGTGDFLKEEYGDRIRYVYQENSGESAARNHGAGKARGEYLVFLDSDDLLCPDAIGKLYSAIKRTGYPASYGRARYDDGEPLNVFKRLGSMPEGDVLDTIVDEKFLNNCNYMIRRDVLAELGGYDETLKNHVDLELFLRLASKIKFAYTASDVAVIRHTEGSARNDYKSFLAQGLGAMERLFEKAPTERLKELKDKLYSMEHLALARACYYERMYPEFRSQYKKALGRGGLTAIKARFIKRYILSYLRALFGV